MTGAEAFSNYGLCPALFTVLLARPALHRCSHFLSLALFTGSSSVAPFHAMPAATVSMRHWRELDEGRSASLGPSPGQPSSVQPEQVQLHTFKTAAGSTTERFALTP